MNKISINTHTQHHFGVNSLKDKNITNPERDDYEDPLTRWPARGLAYTNELGVAISEVAPRTGQLLWVPALMYFGADIYDKYKNQEANYNPSTQRALEQAVFQTLASVILPTAAVYLGQDLISGADKFTKEKLSSNAKEGALKYVDDFVKKSQLSNFENKQETFIQLFKNSFDNALDEKAAAEKSKGFLKRAFSIFMDKKDSALVNADKTRITDYATAELRKILDMRTELMNETKPKNMTEANFKKFTNQLPHYKQEFGAEEYLSKTAKFGLTQHLSSEMFKLKKFKTIGGFIALAALAKPIDKFVEHYVMKKVVEPNFDKIESSLSFKSNSEQ